MQSISVLSIASLALHLATILAAPIPQLAGEGAACNSLLSSTDNGVGYGVENAENNLAGTVSKLGIKTRRQLAGEGAACNSILSSTDNGVGYGTENAENNLAKTVSTGSGAAAQPAPPHKRAPQLDKIAKGAQAIGDAAGKGSTTEPATTGAEGIDGTLTGDAAALGQETGDMEDGTLRNLGSQIPRRQLDKIANGAQALGEALKIGTLTQPATSAGDSIDGTLTGDAANLGAEIGDGEASTLEAIGNLVPKL